MAVLSRPRNDPEGLLQATGRDIAELALTLVWDPSTGTWSPTGMPSGLVTAQATRRAIAELLQAGPARAADLAPKLDMPPNTVTKALGRMVKAGQLATTGDGVFRLPVSDLSQLSEPTHSPASPAHEQDRIGHRQFPIKIVPSPQKVEGSPSEVG